MAAAGSSQETAAFSIRIVNLDYYMAPPLVDMDLPYSTFQGRCSQQVPVIRIFGSTTAGQKTCLHLHKVFPYLYVPYDEDMPQEVDEAFAYVGRFAMAIEQAMKMSSRAGGKKQHVHGCSLVRGRKYYGYHPNEQLFMKIVVYRPQDVSRIGALLLGGGIMNRKFQPHESHIPYLLQLLVDHNLYGMGHIHVAKVKFRHPVPECQLDRAELPKLFKERLEHSPAAGPTPTVRATQSHLWLRTTIPTAWMWPNVASPDSALARTSFCELEADASSEDILNKRDLLFVPLQEAGPELKMVQSLTSIWEEELRRTGEEGAAGAAAQSSPGQRMLPPTSAHEQALRAAVSNLVCQLESRQGPEMDMLLSVRFPSAQSGGGGEAAAGGGGMNEPAVSCQPHFTAVEAVAGSSQLPVSVDGTTTVPVVQGNLLKCTQAANAQRLEDGLHIEMQATEKALDDVEGLVNEEIVRKQSAQPSEPQGTEKEVLDFLCWIGASPDDVNVDNGKIEDEEAACELTQIACSSGVQAALARALSVYEDASNLECEEILDCSKEPESAQNDQDEAGHDNVMVPEATALSFDGGPSKSDTATDMGNSLTGMKIPQLDGQYDEELLSNDGEQQSHRHESKPGSASGPRKGATDDLSRKLQHEVVQSVTSSQVDKGARKRRQQPSKSRSQSSWCSLPLVGGAFPSMASGQEVGKQESIHEGSAYSVETSSTVKDESTSSLRDLMRMRRTRKREKREALLEHPSGVGETDAAKRRKTGLDEGDSRDCGGGQGGERHAPAVCELFGGMVEMEKEVVSTKLNARQADVFPISNGSSAEGSVEQQGLREPELFSFSFGKKPPTPTHCLETLSKYGLGSQEHGSVFFGNVRDVPAQQSVMAGLIFHLKSKEGVHLPPFLFGSPGTASGTDHELYSRRDYVDKELWGAQQGADCRLGVPVHFENDGTISYLLSPAQSPPSQAAVMKWVQQNKAKDDNTSRVAKKQIFSMDANSGKLIAFDDAGEVVTQETQTGCLESLRPASPKYDELHVLASAHQQSIFGPDKSCHQQTGKLARRGRRDVSQITAPSASARHPTPISQSGFRDPASLGAGQQITVASIEVYEETRGDLRPDPRYDVIGCIVVVFQDDYLPREQGCSSFVLVRDEQASPNKKDLDCLLGCHVIYLPDEFAVLNCFIWLIQLYDPDILVGWEIQGFSLGLLAERAAHLGIGLLKQLSRTHMKDAVDVGMNGHQQDVKGGIADKGLFGAVQPEASKMNEPVIDDEWGRTHGSGIYVGGRTVLNLWRIMRGEVKLGMYSVEAVAEVVLRRRVPHIPWRTLTEWFSSGPEKKRHRCLEFFVERARLNLQMMDQLDLLNRTAELARIFGIEFFSVFSRGSQYRVESMMLRLARTQNFVLISPSKQQVAQQPAMECLPLVMEPESRFYTSPVVVLDFQSLYPSIIIAYNLCFSTCLGKITSHNPKQLGVTSMDLQPGLLRELKDRLILAPNGCMYTPPQVRRGVLPRLLDEILSTRIMVKKAMKKLSPEERVRQRVLNARQFALKLIANVTYGYTAAGFSGRMPFAELADSIVQCGRITLERAIHVINAHPTWGGRVVYGDTDSMFVLLEGRTRDEAFKIGHEIASVVTAANPPPVLLKMEKVYHPCVLLTKKRYVGYSYESPGQAKPTFDAKGIETVRRDSCPAVGKIMERSLRVLFESKDLSKVKTYLQRQLGKILSGRMSVHDFTFAKEVRLGTYSANASVLPPAAIVACKSMRVDPRAEPKYGERVRYVVIHGQPGARLVDMVVDPHTLLNNLFSMRLHDTYYITKQIIPSLQRIFGLVGVDLNLWYNEMPRVYQPPSRKGLASAKAWSDFIKLQQRSNQAATIDNYYLSRHCSVCGAHTRGSALVCIQCSKDPRLVTLVMTGRTSQREKELEHLEAICWHCGGDDGSLERKISCKSLDCPVFFERRKVDKELKSVSATLSHWRDSAAAHQRTEMDLF